MKQRQIDFFFKTLDRQWQKPAEIILLGAAAGSLMGNVRPSLDIDFEIRTRRQKDPEIRKMLEDAIRAASQVTGVAVNYSGNVAGWSRIAFLDYRRKALAYKKIGKLTIKIMRPEYWTLGKMARFLELDIQDMIKIIKAKKLTPGVLTDIWARAVCASDLSLELGQFRDHIVYFIRKYGKQVWGRQADLENIVWRFKKKAGLKHF